MNMTFEYYEKNWDATMCEVNEFGFMEMYKYYD